MHIFWKGLKPTPGFFVWCILLGFVRWCSSKSVCLHLLLMLQVWFRWRVTPDSCYKLQTWSFQAFTRTFVTACFARSWCKAGWLISSGVEAGGGLLMEKTWTAGLILHDFIMLLCWRFPNTALRMVGKTALNSGKHVYFACICHKCSHCRSMMTYVAAQHRKCCHTLPRCTLPTTNIDFLEICSCGGLASCMPYGMVRWTDLGPICIKSIKIDSDQGTFLDRKSVV